MQNEYGLLQNEYGVSLISVLVAMGILMIVFLAGLQMTKQTTTGQSQIEYQSRASLVRFSLLETLQFDPQWEVIRANTDTGDTNNIRCTLDPAVANCNTAYNAFTNNTTDTDTDTMDDQRLDVIFGAKNDGSLTSASAFYRMQTASSIRGISSTFSSTSTHDVDGVTNMDCNPATAGLRNCVFKIGLRWGPFNCTTTPCIPNQVQINFDMDLNTDLFTLANAADRSGAFNASRYSFSLVRDVSSATEFFSVANVALNVNADALTTPSPSTTNRRFNRVRYDIGNNIINAATINGAGSTTVSVQPGIYNCEVSAPACATDSHSIQLVNTSESNRVLLYGIPAQAVVGPQGFQCSRSIASGKIVLNTAGSLIVRHVVSGALTLPAYSGGRPATTSNNVYTYMNCEKVKVSK